MSDSGKNGFLRRNSMHKATTMPLNNSMITNNVVTDVRRETATTITVPTVPHIEVLVSD